MATPLNPQTLAGYDGLVIYANTTKITPDQEKALVDFVESGKAFIPLHCASYCFLNSQKYIDLVGAQFLRHGTGVFRTTIAEPDHPIMKGLPTAWMHAQDELWAKRRDVAWIPYNVTGSKAKVYYWRRTE